ncbi:MAG: hypothetical protein R6V53_04950 [Candidatus Woesearchaeota archaeon]
MRALFIGRWCPFHKGHLAIMQEKIDAGIPLLILVRDTKHDIYPADVRKEMIEAAMESVGADAKVRIIDDIESVNYGRGVGYKVEEVEVPVHMHDISATRIRQLINEKDLSWKEMIAPGADTVLESYLNH